MTLAALVLRDTAHDLIYVLTAAGPSGFAALTAGDFSTHVSLLNSGFSIPPGV